MTKLRHRLSPFVGRADVFAIQQPGGAYYPQKRELNELDLDEHEAGFCSIGTYSITPTDDGKFYVNNIVFDLDTYDDDLWQTLVGCVGDFIDLLETEHPYLLLENSGGKGYHIWLHLEKPIEAWHARAWLDADFWPIWNNRTNNTPLEVFPKQDSISPGGYGNLVKLPFGIHAKTGNRSEAVTVRPYKTATSHSVTGYPLVRIPTYEKPAKIANFTPVTPGAKTGLLLSDGPVPKFLRGETAEGERNQTFFAFATWCAWNIHLPFDLAYDWCQRLNDALPNPEEDTHSMRRTMESAYARPPADAATPRTSPRRTPSRASKYRSAPLSERLTTLKAGTNV